MRLVSAMGSQTDVLHTENRCIPIAVVCINLPAMLQRRFASSSAAFWLTVVASLIPSTPSQAARYETRSGDLVFSIDDATGAYALDDGALHFGGRLSAG